ncbi:putative pentatricopeptide [Rosa chinensis]|uniref:Putative pentatricopeptide n=1 Tax=Rosa chinensis TaxID=74649 RepID=A0A2P6RJQ3_ROSCH|nr:putative pentatricopeptide [Rosa chinensis]
MINGYVKTCVYSEAFWLLVEMFRCCNAILLDEYTFSTMAKVSSEVGDLVLRKWGFMGRVKVFDEMPERNVGGFKPDGFTVLILLGLCSGEDVGKLGYGRELHCYIVKSVDLGRRVFERMKRRNVYAWTMMVYSYVQNGASDEELILFWKMQVEDGIEPNRVITCKCSPSLYFRCWFNGWETYSWVRYQEGARRVFEDDSFCKDAIPWSSMISRYGLYGRGEEAIVLYNKMLQLGIKPDITIVGVLSACGRSGLVNEDFSVYSSATADYGIIPTVEVWV